MALCPNSSEYVATSLVNAFHSVPHRDINLAATGDTFELNLDYFQAIVIWVCVPIVVIICLFILMSIYFIVVCCCCCCQQHEERSKGSKISCAVVVFVVVILAVVCCGVGLWAEFAWYSSLNSAVSSASNANGVVQGVQSTAQTINFTVVETSTQGLSQAVTASNSGNTGYTEAMVAAQLLAEEVQALKGSFDQISQDANVQDFSPALDTVSRVDSIAHWVVVAFLIVTALVLLMMMLSVCFGACCKSAICPTLTLFFVGVYAMIVWIAVGVNLGYLVISADVCADPDGLIKSQFNNASTADLPMGTLDYYLVCNEDCYPNPFVDAQFNASQSLANIMGFQEIISEYIDNNPTDGANIQPRLDEVVSSLDGAVNAVNNISTLTNCTQVNMDYLGVLSGLCQDGYLYSLVLFAMACGIAICFVLLMVFGTFFAGLLCKGRLEDEETIVYDFPSDNGGTSPWESYGTQQRYRNSQPNYAGYSEGMNMTATLPTEPPKYTDLQVETDMNGLQQQQQPANYYET